MKNKLLFYLPSLIVFIGTFILFSYHISSSYGLAYDFGRDAMWMYDILHGRLTLLGPKLSFGGYYLGPYYYYLFSHFLLLTRYYPDGALIFNAFLFSISATLIFIILKKNTNTWFSLIPTLWIVFNSYFLFSARNPGNAFTYVSFLTLYITYILFYKIESRLITFLLGIISGLIANFHPVSLLVLIPATIIQLLTKKQKVAIKAKAIIIYLLGIIIMYIPLIIFEVRHGFIMFTNTFIAGSLNVFTNSLNQVSQVVPSKNPFMNFFILNNLIGFWIIPSLLTLQILIFLYL